MTSTLIHRCHFRLHTSPPPHVPRPATASMIPLSSGEDFEAITALPSLSANVPVLVTMSQMQELMVAIVEQANLHLAPLDLCLLTARMPAGPRIPARLLEPDVFLVGNLDMERERLAVRNQRFLSIDNHLVRHNLDAGDNSVTVEWFQERPAPQAWVAFVTSVTALGFAQDDVSMLGMSR